MPHYGADRMFVEFANRPEFQTHKKIQISIFPLEIRWDPASMFRPALVRAEATPMDRFLWESQVEARNGSYFSGIRSGPSFM